MVKPRIKRKPVIRSRKELTYVLLREHFGEITSESLQVTQRSYSSRVRVDLHEAIQSFVHNDEIEVSRFTGVYSRFGGHGRGVGFVDLLNDDRHHAVECSPPEYTQVDIGEDQQVDCLKNGLWLMRHSGLRLAVLMIESERYGRSEGISFFVGIEQVENADDVVARVFQSLSEAIDTAKSYRGKILSLEKDDDYSGKASGVKVHKLRSVHQDQVILPARTLELLDRNVIGFVKQREALRRLGHSTKKGLLFYGPPGTGKTHTLHYLAGALPGHTTLLLAAEQVGLLGDYMSLARLLQPSVVVIEDADLIARDREEMGSVCEEVMLNKLLNEMDGLREDADILFLLTTNRPEALEAALASRPGRVDQAIEFPLPDEVGRRKLVDLYARGVSIAEEVKEEIVRKTDGSSAALIKELLRRATQFQLDEDDAHQLLIEAVNQALEQMLFQSGELNRRLLGEHGSH